MKTYFASFLFLLAVLAIASAATLESELANYVERNETYSVEVLTANGTNYSLIKIGGTPSLVFNTNNELETTPAIIDAVAEAHSMQRINALRQTEGFQNLGMHFQAVYDEFMLCDETSKPVLEPTMVDYYSLAFGGNDPRIRSAYADLRAHNASLHVLFAELKTSVDRMAGLNGKALYDELGVMVTKSAESQVHLTNYSEATSYLRTYFGDDFAIPAKNVFRYICQLGSTSMASFSNDLSIRSSIPIASDIATQIKAGTEARSPKAGLRKKVAELAVDYNNAMTKVNSAKKQFPIGEAFLSQKQNELTTAFQRLNSTNASNPTATLDLIKAFNLTRDSLGATIASLERQYPAYTEAATAVDTAKQTMAAARERFGRNDERVTSFQTQANTLSNRFSVAEDGVRTGSANATELVEIKAIALNITGSLNSLTPKENTVDYVTIGVIAIIIVGFLGLIVYALKFRKKSAPSPSRQASFARELREIR